jgi:hypothetical protein
MQGWTQLQGVGFRLQLPTFWQRRRHVPGCLTSDNQPRSITTDKAHSYAHIFGEMNRFELPGEGIRFCRKVFLNVD